MSGVLLDNILKPADNKAKLQAVTINNEIFYKISGVDAMRPFFMSIVSDSNHWMFIASNGGLSAGRKDAEQALFPYYTDDKITASVENTGSKTIFWVKKDDEQFLWEPFSVRSEGRYKTVRNLYKSRFGNKIIFEEINETLEISFQYQWCSSNLYGFVRKAVLTNLAKVNVNIKLLDGVQNILPYGVSSDLQNSSSNLANAYKRSELVTETDIGIYALSAIITDKAEPSEALKANIAWCTGLGNCEHLLSSLQLNKFRLQGIAKQEDDIKGESGAYFVISELTLGANDSKEWMVLLNVNQNHSAIVQLSESLKTDQDIAKKVLADVSLGTDQLISLAAAADGLQNSADDAGDTRHFSNVLFNIMRGGIFDHNYQIEKNDFSNYLHKANSAVFAATQQQLQLLPETFSLAQLKQVALQLNNIDFQRLATEYLPLKFSRRHGDPSRPWNRFSINTRSETDGSKILDYQGNWRDIFQNWEALAHSYPEFLEGMIYKFLNASTFDGYNPYRVTKDGFDWETIEPDNPWSYIGYWGDHQIIYLLKFLELYETHQPGHIQKILKQNGFVYAHVPYLIKPYQDILRNPKDTIVFDHKSDSIILERMQRTGADGALHTNADGEIYHVNFCEKILAVVLSKLSNLVADGGIWMNTQRPEWNDANNALVGNGLSMVTLCYLRRFLKFFENIFEKDTTAEITVSAPLADCFEKTAAVLEQNKQYLSGNVNDGIRKKMTDALGEAASEYRSEIYENGFSTNKKVLTTGQILACFSTANKYLEHAITVNERADGLYHTYNLLSYNDVSMQVGHLAEMLEGQVAVLSSGYLSAQQSVNVLDALKESALYRADQNSYILYPNKNLPGFLQKNNLPEELIENSLLLQQLLRDGNRSIIEKDVNGTLHFNGNFRNANDVETALDKLEQPYTELVSKEKKPVLQIFEEVFNHKEFTGRSGTFYGYEGLGSIYWHMVSKLLLAVQETCLRAISSGEPRAIIEQLTKHYYSIKEGIGVHKPPQLYGAFPTDPYSHTPFGKGAQQPGMTGQVKEDILCRFGELGVMVSEGRLLFNPVLLQKGEFNPDAQQVEYVDVNGEKQVLALKANSLFFTCCQVPVVYELGKEDGIEITRLDGSIAQNETESLPQNDSQEIFARSGKVKMIKVLLNEERLMM